MSGRQSEVCHCLPPQGLGDPALGFEEPLKQMRHDHGSKGFYAREKEEEGSFRQNEESKCAISEHCSDSMVSTCQSVLSCCESFKACEDWYADLVFALTKVSFEESPWRSNSLGFRFSDFPIFSKHPAHFQKTTFLSVGLSAQVFRKFSDLRNRAAIAELENGK